MTNEPIRFADRQPVVVQPHPVQIWEWQPFGSPWVRVFFPHEVSWLARMTCRLLLGSKWTRVAPKA